MLQKNRTSLWLSISLFLCSQITLSCSKPANPDEIFLKQLDRFVVSMKGGAEAESMASLRQMEKFSKQHPRSKYSDDAQFITTMMILAGQWKPELVRNFLAQYSSDKVENETAIRLEQVMGPDIYLPYDIYFLLPEALYDAQQKNFKSAKEKNMRVLQTIDSGESPQLQKLRPSITRLISIYNARMENK